MKNNNKRNYYSSSSPESPNSTRTEPIKKKILASQSQFGILSQDENQDEMLDTNSTTLPTEQIDVDVNVTIKPPPPTFVKGVDDFPELCLTLI